MTDVSMTRPLVYVVTLAHNRREDTLECLGSLAQSTYQNMRIVVVDNGSTDGTPAAVRASFPTAHVIETGENKGFAAGVNIGVRHSLGAGADQILVVNNDTLFDPPMLAGLLAHAAPDVAALSPLIYYAGAPAVIWSSGGMRNRWTLEQVGSLRGQRDDGRWRETVERDFVPGCAMLIPRATFESVGLFDERFFMYYEDNDWCLRARRAGWRLLLVPDARLWHKVSMSSGGSDSAGERYWMGRGSVIFFRKHVRGAQWGIVAPYRLGSAVKTATRLLLARRSDAARAYVRGLLDGMQVSLT